MAAEQAATLQRQGDALVFAGALDRGAATALWQQALSQLQGVSRIDLAAVPRVDSSGLALLAELCARGNGIALAQAPAELAELCAAYRLDPHLEFQASSVQDPV
ncbi:STAS domain-containing protein [Stenotrophomonas sp. MMGLT7]|uniref:STAS domain-containing protein n=1 Tax=Stenotrophomonas sp. MMGLT7 TaxID=2901227 RepID=UPI001E4F89F8|nr:STAS domain-containing protein [Stenotrophomonas sp. MMGLT7]MCD7098451.1 STAS domain-containing protein [Stenotrophomonas sp. MMGLT7]